MRYLSFFCILFLLVLQGMPACGQADNLMPVRFSLFTNTMPELNPALMDMSRANSMTAGSQITSGGFEMVHAFYLNGFFSIIKKSRTPQRIGISLIGDREGELISKNWLKLQYAIGIPLTEKFRLVGGFQAGAINYFVRNTAISPGGSDFAPVLTVGLKLNNEYGYLGVSINQFGQSSVTPIENPVNLCQHINITSAHDFNISPRFTFTPAFWVRLPKNLSTQYSISAEALIDDQFSVQSLWFHENSLSLGVGIKNVSLWQLNLTFQFVYTIPFGKGILSQFKLYEAYVDLHDY